ncbi:MAG: TIGR01777 family protein [Deltaproteobacteria bacterium]|nr:TIGR01777 family protein [Deltaproteobacteria bacterium]
MKWVVTGGTGFIGRALTTELIARGDEVAVLSRGSAPGSAGKARRVAWTPGRIGAWTQELEGADAVVNLAGAGVMDARWSEARLAEVRSSRVDTTRVLAEAIATSKSRPGVLLSASAVGIYGMRMDDEMVDEDGAQGTDVLARICQDWEKAAQPAREVGVRVAHPRIGIVFGRGGGALERMIPPFRAFVGGPIGSGQQWMSWIHVQDVVAALCFAAQTASITGPFNVVAPEPVRMQELARTLGAVLGRPSAMRVPAFALRALLGDGAEAILTGQRVRPGRLLKAGFEFGHARLREALEDVTSRKAA